MPTPQFIQIVSSANSTGHVLYGLTANGAVFKYDLLRDQPSKSTQYQSYHHEWIPCVNATEES